MSDDLSRRQFYACVQEAATRMERAEAALMERGEAEPPCTLSWAGFNLRGDNASIKEARRLLHDAGTVPELKAALQEARRVAQGRSQPPLLQDCDRNLSSALAEECKELANELATEPYVATLQRLHNAIDRLATMPNSTGGQA